MWKPESLENPYNFSRGGAIPKYEVQSRCFDEGADAMLEALRENSKMMKAYVRFIEEPKGTWVFIPDKDSNDNSTTS